MSFFEEVYRLVRRVPKGKVTTYGEIARALGSRDARRVGPRKDFSTSSSMPSDSENQRGKHAIDPRMVGWALHANKDSNTPCHRVVDRNGRLAPNFGGPFAFSGRAGSGFARDGASEQRRRLEEEGVKFADEMHVDLEKYLWEP